ncbi:type II toxin-antitoxin system Phd/YefM family antitoxin [Lonepinella koalarum]|uniref:Antitoxin StbD n=2 Tax=Lonepinella koalarum TaxID=53417 RepID=A0A4R1KS21_9PAST|nr:stability protein StbD [Lonepinella koalarum]MDH2926610.1 stability protein StbD [Lonepinella koalarum]TCK66929.1 antitoxin StbD [Lonepinella koalarum]TFJ88786.1 stability protein StbD [Lonepinella koalarum]
MPINPIYTTATASISDLKKDPMGIISAGTSHTGTMAILNRNKPVFYCVSPELFAYLQDAIEDFELGITALARKADGKLIAVNPDEL